MRRTALRRMLLVVLGIMMLLGAIGVPAAAQDAPNPESTATAVVEDESVSALPATGRGSGDDASDTQRFAAEQMMVTVLVLIAAGTLSLGVIAVAWRYDRQ